MTLYYTVHPCSGIKGKQPYNQQSKAMRREKARGTLPSVTLALPPLCLHTHKKITSRDFTMLAFGPVLMVLKQKHN